MRATARAGGRWWVAGLSAGFFWLFLLALASPARASDDDALVRVIAEKANVHTGPGFSFRTVYVAEQGEVFPAMARASSGHWFRVQLPDGTYGWILGDEVFPVIVDATSPRESPSWGSRFVDAVFSPPPWLDGQVGLAFSAGVLGEQTGFLFRPSYVFEPHVALEGFVGESVGPQVDVFYFGAGANVLLFPRSPVTPFLGAAGGGAAGRAKVDQISAPGTYALMNAGGGLLFAFKKRLIVRGDARHYVVFDPNHIQSFQEFSGALAVIF